MAVYPDPGFSPAWTYVWLIGSAALFLFRWGIARHFNYLGEGFFPLSIALVFGYFTNKWAEYQARVKYRIIPGVY